MEKGRLLGDLTKQGVSLLTVVDIQVYTNHKWETNCKSEELKLEELCVT